MTKLTDVPLTRPAANERSPLRKPRARGQRIQAIKVGYQEAFLAFIRVGDSRARAAGRARVLPKTVERWQADDPEFARLYREAQEEGKAMIEGRLDGLTPRAVDVAEDTLENKDPKLAWDAAHKILRGRGLLRDVDTHAILGDITFRVIYDDDRNERTDNPPAELPEPPGPGPVRQ